MACYDGQHVSGHYDDDEEERLVIDMEEAIDTEIDTEIDNLDCAEEEEEEEGKKTAEILATAKESALFKKNMKGLSKLIGQTNREIIDERRLIKAYRAKRANRESAYRAAVKAVKDTKSACRCRNFMKFSQQQAELWDGKVWGWQGGMDILRKIEVEIGTSVARVGIGQLRMLFTDRYFGDGGPPCRRCRAFLRCESRRLAQEDVLPPTEVVRTHTLSCVCARCDLLVRVQGAYNNMTYHDRLLAESWRVPSSGHCMWRSSMGDWETCIVLIAEMKVTDGLSKVIICDLVSKYYFALPRDRECRVCKLD